MEMYSLLSSNKIGRMSAVLGLAGILTGCSPADNSRINNQTEQPQATTLIVEQDNSLSEQIGEPTLVASVTREEVSPNRPYKQIKLKKVEVKVEEDIQSDLVFFQPKQGGRVFQGKGLLCELIDGNYVMGMKKFRLQPVLNYTGNSDIVTGSLYLSSTDVSNLPFDELHRSIEQNPEDFSEEGLSVSDRGIRSDNMHLDFYHDLKLAIFDFNLTIPNGNYRLDADIETSEGVSVHEHVDFSVYNKKK